ncbi:MAG: glycosyltransferase [Bacteroidales bacterium]|jgi:glycosyltransferase involved in cell wall biosynthesis|nr:glycosyltransferase [Bacteroidales bacterium]
MEWLPLILLLPYLLLLLNLYKKLKSVRPYRAEKGINTFISVVVACRNEESKLPGLLESLSLQDYNHEMFELIVVDDNSEDNTRDLALSYKGIKNLKVLVNRGTGKKRAIATGVEDAAGELIVTTDADCSMGKGWLTTIVSFYLSESPDLIIAPVGLTGGKGFFMNFQELEFLSLQGVSAGAAASGNAVMCNGANLAFRKEVYLRNLDNLHFDINTGDDIFLLHAIKKELSPKIKWLESGEARVTASSQPDISSFILQRRRWISKWRIYDDRLTIITGAFTFAAALVPLFLMAASAVSARFFLPLLAFLALKSIPDYLILSDTATRYGRRSLLHWFIPSQLVYPFYVLVVAGTEIFRHRKKRLVAHL